MKNRLVLISTIFAFLLNSSPSKACIHFIDGGDSQRVERSTLREQLLQHETQQTWQNRVDEWQKLADKQWDFTSQNNLAASLAHVGRFDEALKRMQTIERVLPGHPFTAYNMATVYELQGDSLRALKWVKTGIEREAHSPSEHELNGTEWLHLLILKAKLRNQFAPESLGATSITGLDFGNGPEPQVPATLPPNTLEGQLSLEQVRQSLFEQTHERLEFVPKPDPVIADLLFDLGNITELGDNKDDARDVFALALDYQPKRRDLVQKRFDYLEGKPNYLLILPPLAVLCCAGAGFWLNRQAKSKSDYQALPVQTLDEFAPPKANHIDFSRYDNDSPKDGNS